MPTGFLGRRVRGLGNAPLLQWKGGETGCRERSSTCSPARTTEEGLKALNGLKARLGIGWDGLVIDAVCAHYGLDRLVMALPKAYKPAKESKEKQKGGKHGKGRTANQKTTEPTTVT